MHGQSMIELLNCSTGNLGGFPYSNEKKKKKKKSCVCRGSNCIKCPALSASKGYRRETVI